MKYPVTETWQNAYTLSGLAPGSELAIKPSGAAVYVVIGGSQPTIQPQDGDDIQPFNDGFVPAGASVVWIAAVNTTEAEIRNPESAVLGSVHIPSSVFQGDSAITIQDIIHAAKKLGKVWEASRKITLGPLASGYSIIKTGAKPCILMERVLGCTGEGVTGSIFKTPTYSSIGTEDPMYNLSGINPQPRLVKLYAGTVPTNNGTQVGADIFVLSSSSNQSKGVAPREFGSRRALAPDSEYLLVLASSDSASQTVSAEIVVIEGDIDLPV
jgi:hypothetical protein